MAGRSDGTSPPSLPTEPGQSLPELLWAITYGDCAKWFMEFIYSRVVTLGHDPKRVRMVMLFDN